MSTAGRFAVSDINRKKGLHSIVAQVVCDHEMNCISNNTGWPGSVHDDRVFLNSKMWKRIINITILPEPEDFHFGWGCSLSVTSCFSKSDDTI